MPIGLNHETEIARPGMDSITEVGSIYGTARSTVPSGYLLCDGSTISRTVYSRLFSAIGITYGVGDGSTTFTLPDLRGAVPRGAGTSTGYSQNVTLTLGAKNNDTMQGHRHFAGYADGTNNSSLGGVMVGDGASIYGDAVNNWSTRSAFVNDPRTDNTNGTPRIANETQTKNQVVNFFIKF
jgi:microcystin-dependent protein